MHFVLVVLALLAGTSTASAEVWFTREGTCGEWRSRWNVEQDQSGLWVGSMDHMHVGGPCVQGTGQRYSSKVQAVIVGESFFALRHTGGNCLYHGQIQGDRVRGIELCEGVATRVNFAGRFPPGERGEARQRYEQRPVEREDDDWLDNPQTHDRDRSPGFGREVRPGPRQ